MREREVCGYENDDTLANSIIDVVNLFYSVHFFHNNKIHGYVDTIVNQYSHLKEFEYIIQL